MPPVTAHPTPVEREDRERRMEAMLTRLTTAMLGDEGMGTQGLVAQLAEVKGTVAQHEERLEVVEGERTLEADDRAWTKSVRQNWSSPARLALAALGIAIPAIIGALVTKWMGTP